MPGVFRRCFALLFLTITLPGAVCDDLGVRVVEEREGNVIRLFVETTNCLDITLTLSAKLQNMRASAPLPVTLDTRGRSRVEVIRLEPVSPAEAWRYQWTHHWRYGSRGGRPDDSSYQLPFAADVRRTLIQGYRGAFSHRAGSLNEHAHDWEMPEGTVVYAARAGTVVGVRQDSTAGGVGEQFKNCANYVIIRHSDGTYAEYLHLQAGGARVKAGDSVTAGQPLALSGNTGHSSRPHLHFAVFRAIDGSKRESLPVTFQLRDGTVGSPKQGRRY